MSVADNIQKCKELAKNGIPLHYVADIDAISFDTMKLFTDTYLTGKAQTLLVRLRGADE